jgi:hypothetical protein
VIVVKKLQNKNIKWYDCNYYIDGQCSGEFCGYFKERTAAGLICYEDIVEECYKDLKLYHLNKRLAQLVRNFDGEIFLNTIHRSRFFTVCRIQNLSVELNSFIWLNLFLLIFQY